MPFDWWKKKYIFSPNNPHSIRRLLLHDQFYPDYWEWICPDNYWFELLSFCHRLVTQAGVRKTGNLWLFLYSGIAHAGIYHTRVSIISSINYYFSWHTSGAQPITIPGLTYYQEYLPTGIYVFPGNRLQLFWRDPITWDAIYNPVLTMKRYELY
jgi:hypothetical protein